MHEEASGESPAQVQRDQRANVLLAAVIEHLGGKQETKHRVRELSPVMFGSTTWVVSGLRLLSSY